MLNPFSADKPQLEVNAQVGKTNVQEKRTQLVEAKATSHSSTSNVNKADTINQDYTNVEPWMVLLVALGFGLALPSPMAWYSNRRERVFLKEQIRYYRELYKEPKNEPKSKPESK